MAPEREMEGVEFVVATNKRHRRSSGKRKNEFIIPPHGRLEKKQTSRHQSKHEHSSYSRREGSLSTSTKERTTPIKRKAEARAETSFINECLKRGLLLESLVLEYTLSYKDAALFTSDKISSNSEDLLKKLAFVHPYGDHFTILNLAREWVKQVAKQNVNAWCESSGISQEELKQMENYLERRRKELRISPRLFNFSENAPKADAELKRVLVEQNEDGLCVFKGHPDLGYWSANKWRTLHLHRNSLLNRLGSYNKYIIVLQDLSTDDVIYKALVIDDAEGDIIMSEKFGPCMDILKEIRVEASDIEIKSETILDEVHKRFEENYEGCLKQRVTGISGDSTVLLSKRTTGLKLYCLLKHQKNISELLQEESRAIKTELSTRLYELPYPEQESHVRALVGSGNVLKEVLLPHQYRSVLVRETKLDSLTREQVMHTMSKYGEVECIKRRNDRDRRMDGKWGVITFKQPESVQKLLADYSKCENMLLELAPFHDNEKTLQFSIDSTVSVRVSYCRRPVNSGKASVSFRARKDFSKALRTKAFTVKGRTISGLKAGPKETFKIEGLHILTTEEDINAGLKTVGLAPSDTVLDREQPFECTAGELEKFKSSLTKVLDKVTDIRKTNVQVIKASKEDVSLQAVITFDKQRTANSALENLHKTKIQGLPLVIHDDEDAKTTGGAKVMISHKLYKAVQSDLETLMKKTKQKFEMDITITSSEKCVVLTLEKDNLPNVIDLFLERIENLLSPVTFALKRANLRYLTLGKGNDMILAVQAMTKCFIEMNESKVNIYGNPSARTEAAKLFKTFLAEKHNWFKYPISDGDHNSLEGAAKVFKKFGSDLSGIESKEKMVDEASNAFIFSSEDGASEEPLLESLRDCFLTSVSKQEEELPECGACFCQPSSASDVYHLETCGHAYCSECIQEHVKHSIYDHKFPIQCANEDCEEPICIPELLRLASTSLKGGVKYLTKVTVDDFVAKHGQNWTYCYKPYCQGVVFKDERFEAYTCLTCYAAMCKKCSSTRHSGDCDDYMNRRALDSWFAESADRRKCPNCKMGIEKVDGCNRVFCETCQVHICWRCMCYYKGMDECYDHLNKEHGGPY